MLSHVAIHGHRVTVVAHHGLRWALEREHPNTLQQREGVWPLKVSYPGYEKPLVMANFFFQGNDSKLRVNYHLARNGALSIDGTIVDQLSPANGLNINPLVYIPTPRQGSTNPQATIFERANGSPSIEIFTRGALNELLTGYGRNLADLRARQDEHPALLQAFAWYDDPSGSFDQLSPLERMAYRRLVKLSLKTSTGSHQRAEVSDLMMEGETWVDAEDSRSPAPGNNPLTRPFTILEHGGSKDYQGQGLRVRLWYGDELLLSRSQANRCVQVYL